MLPSLANGFREFLRLEASGGILLLGAAVLAMVLNNSPLSPYYDALLQTPVEVRVGALRIDKPLLLWINDGLMAVFFLLVGLEVKREMLEGQLRGLQRIALPGTAALGGMLVPALVYFLLNRDDPLALDGWAIPTATDIAFALGVLALLGNRVPQALKLFLLTLAIFDDLGAIVIIALFYTGDLSVTSLALAGLGVAGLLALNLSGVRKPAAYVLVGLFVWVSVLKSGVHATLAGVALALAIPLRPAPGSDLSPLREMEHALHPWVAFGILPLFAFANSGVALAGLGLEALLHPVPLGIALGLFLGKQAGVLGFAWLAVRLGIARLPQGVGWLSLYGVSVLCGIGFTMSLFIGSLAFEMGGPHMESGDTLQVVNDRLGILTGSFLSAVVGYAVLRYALSRVASKKGDS
jgi:NhaA family Na+:H+ antiporter